MQITALTGHGIKCLNPVRGVDIYCHVFRVSFCLAVDGSTVSGDLPYVWRIHSFRSNFEPQAGCRSNP